MSDLDTSALSQRMWMAPGKSPKHVLLTEIKTIAIALARKLGSKDPENDGCEALVHLLEQTPKHVAQFFDDAQQPDTAAFQRWSRVVLRNRIIRLRQVSTRLKTTGLDDESNLEALAHQAGQHTGSWLKTPERMMIQRDKLIVLLRLISGLKQSQKQVLLARMSGFNRKQIAKALSFSEMGQSVLISRLRTHIQPSEDGESVTESFRLPLQSPEYDEPLQTEQTQHIKKALENLSSDFGTELLIGINDLSPEHSCAYITRLAGFWDCVIATVMNINLNAQASRVARARTSLERRLGQYPEKQGKTPLDLKTISTPHTGANMPGSSEAAYWAHLAQVLPEVALSQLLVDPDVHTALHKPWAHSSETPVANQLWQAVRGIAHRLGDCISPVMLAPLLPVRSEISGDSSSATVLSFDSSSAAWGERHCVVWKLKDGGALKQVYPKHAGQPNQGQNVRGRRWPVVSESGGTRLLIAWMEPSAWLSYQKLARDEQATWLQDTLTNNASQIDVMAKIVHKNQRF